MPNEIRRMPPIHGTQMRYALQHLLSVAKMEADSDNNLRSAIMVPAIERVIGDFAHAENWAAEMMDPEIAFLALNGYEKAVYELALLTWHDEMSKPEMAGSNMQAAFFELWNWWNTPGTEWKAV